jgi:hypothetical protein
MLGIEKQRCTFCPCRSPARFVPIYLASFTELMSVTVRPFFTLRPRMSLRAHNVGFTCVVFYIRVLFGVCRTSVLIFL